MKNGCRYQIPACPTGWVPFAFEFVDWYVKMYGLDSGMRFRCTIPRIRRSEVCADTDTTLPRSYKLKVDSEPKACTGFGSEETENATKLYCCVASAMVFLIRPAKCMPHLRTSKTLTVIPHQANPAALPSQTSLPAPNQYVYVHYRSTMTPSLLSNNWPNGPMARRLTTIQIRYQEIPGCKFHPFNSLLFELLV
jgi:hypothetical protein